MTRVAIGPQNGDKAMNATTTHAPEPLERANAFTLHATRVIRAPREHVFHFLTHEVPRTYTLLSPGHERYDVVGGGPLVLGATIDCRESTGNQEVRHLYRVESLVEPSFLQFSSIPSKTFVHLPDRTIEGTSETIVRYELTVGEDGTTRLAMTIVIVLDSRWTKLLASFSGTRRLWAEHQQGELDRLVALVEATSPQRARRLAWVEA